jgi:hypothetical protein
VDPETRYLLRDDVDGGAEAGGAAGDGDGDGVVSSESEGAAAQRTRTSLSDTEGGVTRDAGEESLEDIIRKARNTPDFWSADNPVLVGTAVSIGAAALFGVIDH